jgi:hypothetical protein
LQYVSFKVDFFLKHKPSMEKVWHFFGKRNF